MSTHDSKQAKLQEELSLLAGEDAILARMLKMGRPLTLETYVVMNWPGRTVEQLGAEELSEIPAPLLSAGPSDETDETEEDGIRAEAIRREQVRRAAAKAWKPSTGTK